MSVPANWATPLSKPAGLQVIVEVIIDPDGRHIVLDGYRDIKQMSSVRYGVDIRPENLGQIILTDLYLTFNDHNEIFNPYCQRSGYRPFRNVWNVLDASTTATSVQLKEWAGAEFIAGDTVVFSDGTTN